MATFTQKYPNNSREVSGTPTIYASDVSLLCKTSLGPVTINLLEIPDGYWNTTYKMYVTDLDDNAGVNNIVINAGAGQTINNASSFTMSTNGQGIMIRILSNDEYLVTNSNASSSSGYDQIQDEGVNLVKRQILNFIGPGVEAVDDAPNLRTNVRVKGGIEDITHANLTALAAAGTVQEGQLYRVTDPAYAHNLVVTGTSPTTISVECMARWLVTDYQNTGDYSGVPTYNSSIGVWNSALAPAIGDVCIWNNYHYVNNTGINGANPPPADAVNWTLLAKTVTTGYVLESEFGLYNFELNRIIRRFDKRGNDIEFSQSKGVLLWTWFPFGSDKVRCNRCIGNVTNVTGISNLLGGAISSIANNIIKGTLSAAGYFPTGNILCQFTNNEVESTGIINFGGACVNTVQYIANKVSGNLQVLNVTSTVNKIIVEGNQVDYGSFLTISGVTGTFDLTVSNNNFSAEAQLQFTTCTVNTQNMFIESNTHINDHNFTLTALANPADWKYNYVNYEGGFVFPAISDNAKEGGAYDILDMDVVSTFPKEIDMNTDYDLPSTTLNLGAEQIYGEYNVKNGTGQTISKINGGPWTGRPFKLIANNAVPGICFRFTATAIAAAVVDDVVSNSSQTFEQAHNTYADSLENSTLVRGKNGGTGPVFVKQQETWN